MSSKHLAHRGTPRNSASPSTGRGGASIGTSGQGQSLGVGPSPVNATPPTQISSYQSSKSGSGTGAPAERRLEQAGNQPAEYGSLFSGALLTEVHADHCDVFGTEARNGHRVPSWSRQADKLHMSLQHPSPPPNAKRSGDVSSNTIDDCRAGFLGRFMEPSIKKGYMGPELQEVEIDEVLICHGGNGCVLRAQ